MSKVVQVTANYYQQFHADPRLDVPAENYGGWKRGNLPLALDHTAVVMMHAWDYGAPEQHPGWWRSEEAMLRMQQITRQVFPTLLAAVRRSPLRLYHVVGGGQYYQHLPGYQRVATMAPRFEWWPSVKSEPVLRELRQFKSAHAYPGAENLPDIQRAFETVDFPPEARPLDKEPIVEYPPQMFALCNQDQVNHLIYVGFNINWCLLTSPCGMVDMGRHGVLCSTIRQATTAVENRESARRELYKEEALWRISVGYGYVFDLEDFLTAIAPRAADVS